MNIGKARCQLGLTFAVILICVYVFAASAEETTKKPASTQIAQRSLPPFGVDTISDLVEQVTPSVVNIACLGGRIPVTHVAKESDDPGKKLRRHFGLDAQNGDSGGQVRTWGAGMFVRSDGYVLTCLHVVQNADEITVSLNDGRKFPAQIVGKDPFVDLAVVKIRGTGLPVVKFADTSQLRVGQWVVAIGNPYAYESSVSAGLISGLHRKALSYTQAFGARTGAITFIQTDVPLNAGSSGGPLLNLEGEVVGINSFIRVDPQNSPQNIGFATPADQIQKVAEELIQRGSASHPYLGIEMQDQSELPEGAGLVSGVEVTKVKSPSPASRAGLLVGDLVVEMDSTAVHSPSDVSRIVAAHAVGDHISLRVKRSGADKNLSVKVENLPDEFD